MPKQDAVFAGHVRAIQKAQVRLKETKVSLADAIKVALVENRITPAEAAKFRRRFKEK